MIIEVIDPRGFSVVLHNDHWTYILKKHPELENYLEEVRQAIEDPAHGCIYRSHREPKQCQVYYRKIEGKRAEIKVIVDFFTDDFGEIRNAYFCSNRPDGEELIWPKLSP